MFRRSQGRTNHYVRFRGRGLPPIRMRQRGADEEVGYGDEDPEIYIDQEEDETVETGNGQDDDEVDPEDDEYEEEEDGDYEEDIEVCVPHL